MLDLINVDRHEYIACNFILTNIAVKHLLYITLYMLLFEADFLNATNKR
jgi:hypothetical protein